MIFGKGEIKVGKSLDAEISEEQVKGLNNFLEQMTPEELEKIAGGFSAAGAAAALSGGAKIMADKLLGGLSEHSKKMLKRLGMGAAAVLSLYLLYRVLPKNGSLPVEKSSSEQNLPITPSEAINRFSKNNGGLTDEQMKRLNDLPIDESCWTFDDVKWCLYGFRSGDLN